MRRACILLELPIVIGRGQQAEIRLDDPRVEEKHCIIYREGDCVMVQDLNTAAGTYLNGKPILQGSLRQGDHLSVAGRTFLVSALGPQAAPISQSPEPPLGWPCIRDPHGNLQMLNIAYALG
jgi:pSer/pThr/pTyr-binding forkhead associated (FHA) protein